MSTHSFSPLSLPYLLDLAQEGKLVLPQFQREWVWRDPQRTLDLLRTVARGWPAGSILLLEGSGGFPSRTLEGVQADPAEDPTFSVLDGQQRLTALYRSFRGRSGNHVFFARIGDLVAKDELEDEDLDLLTRRRFEEDFSFPERAGHGVATVEELVDDNMWDRWLGALPSQDARAAFIDARKRHFGGFGAFLFPTITLQRGIDIRALVQIFVTLNRTGVRLDAFDLMVAKTWREDFNLRELWNAAIDRTTATHPRLLQFGVAGIELLRLIALQRHFYLLRSGEDTSRIKNVGDQYIIRLEPDEVRDSWESALKTYTNAIEFLADRCGVAGRQALPSSATVLPLAHALNLVPRDGFHDDLVRWFWCSTFLGTYGKGGTNTRVIEDALALERWNDNVDEEPPDVANFRRDWDSEILAQTTERNLAIRAGIVALQTHLGAKDWVDPEELVESTGDELQLHHVFPESRVNEDLHGPIAIAGDPNTLINFVLIRRRTNRLIGDSAPDALAPFGVNYDYVETHLLDRRTLGQWTSFVVDRLSKLNREIDRVTNRPNGA